MGRVCYQRGSYDVQYFLYNINVHSLFPSNHKITNYKFLITLNIIHTISKSE